MKNKTKKNILKYLLCGFLFAIALVLPDYVLKLALGNSAVIFHLGTFMFAVALGLAITTIKSRVFFWSFSIILMGLVFGGCFHYIFFGRFFLGHDVAMLFKETSDIAIGVLSDILKNWYLSFACLISFLIIAYTRKISENLRKSNWGILFFLFVISFIPRQQINSKNTRHRIPNPIYYTYYNSLKSMSHYFLEIAFEKNVDIPKFEDYKITKERDVKEKTTVILLMGESWNPDHFSLFGYERKTTPNLDKFVKENNVYFNKGLSYSVATIFSLAGFFNLQKEPLNFLLQHTKKNNLFKLAKEAGFYNEFISVQTLSSFPNIGLEFIDDTYYLDKNPIDIKSSGDLFWLEKLKSTELKDKNFITIQTRLVHYPYGQNCPLKENVDVFNDSNVDDRINKYDNGVYCLDKLFKEFLDYVKTIDGKVYVIITSDHSEAFGEDNVWGHCFLRQDIATVPFILYTKNVLQNDLKYIKNLPYPSHYDMGKFILSIFGYKVENPNTSDDVIYVSGMDMFGRAGNLLFKRNGKDIMQVYP